MNFTEIAALIGVVTGPIGLVLSILAYSRDAARLWVTLRTGTKIHNSTVYDANKTYWVAEVTNIGRRPAFVDMVAVVFPSGSTGIIDDSLLAPVKLEEGGSPKHYMMEQDQLEDFQNNWPGIVVVVRTSAGLQYRSKFLRGCPTGANKLSFVAMLGKRLKTRLQVRWAFKKRKLF